MSGKTLPHDQNEKNRYPTFDQTSYKTIPFGTAHTYLYSQFNGVLPAPYYLPKWPVDTPLSKS